MARVLFRRPLPKRYGPVSRHTAFQRSFPGGGCTPSRVNVLVAAFADHKGLSFTHGHQVHPRRPFRPSWLVEIGKLADVVDLQSFTSLAHLALPGEQPVDQLISPGRGHDRIAVRNDGGALALERDSAEAGNQRLLTLSRCTVT